MGWRDTITSAQDPDSTTKSWRDTIQTPPSSNDPTFAQGLLSGAEKGATMGMDEKLGGLIQAGLELGNRGLNTVGLADRSPGQVIQDLNAKGIQTGQTGTLGEAYQQGRDLRQNEADRIAKAQPSADTIGDVAGSIISPINALTGGIGSLAARGAVEGGIRAAGDTQATNLGDAAKDVAKSAVFGGVLGGLANKAQGAVEDASHVLSQSNPAEKVANLIQDIPISKFGTAGGIMGAGVGHTVAGTPGAAAGYLTGNTLGQKAGNFLKNTVTPDSELVNNFDTKVMSTFMRLPQVYKKVFTDSALRGGQSQAVTHYILSQRDPKYQELTSKEGSQSTDLDSDSTD